MNETLRMSNEQTLAMLYYTSSHTTYGLQHAAHGYFWFWFHTRFVVMSL